MTSTAATTEPGLSIVVVTWNSSATLAPLLAELTGLDDVEIIVADNDSADDSLGVAAAAAPDAIRIRTGGNCGFAGGVNAGAAAATRDVLVLLNPDCVAGADDLRHLADRVRGGLGIAAPRLTDASGAVTRSVRRRATVRDQFVVAAGLHKVSDRLDPDSDGGASTATVPVAVDVVSGACFATPLALFRELGGLDERFFLYGEEVDYMVRVTEAGGRIEYDPGATVMHIGGTAADQVSTGTDFLLMESRVRWFHKHHGRVAAQFARVALAAWALRRRDRAAISAMFRPMKKILTPTHPRPKPVRVDE